MQMNMYCFCLISSKYGIAGPHEYPQSLYKHVHAVGGEDGDQIMKSGSERI